MKKYFIYILIICLSFGSGILFWNIRNEESKINIILKEQVPWAKAEKENNEANQDTLNKLLKHIGFAEEALRSFTVDNPEEAVSLWSEGMISGNGVLQYSVMDIKLQEEFKAYMQKKGNISWDTRIEDKTIDRYEIIDYTEVSEKIKIYNLKFIYINASGVEGERFYDLTVVEEQNTWLISAIR